MNACLSATGLMQRLGLMCGVFAISLLCGGEIAQAAPVVVSVDHRVTVGYSRVEFNARKGIYTTQVRIRNRSGTALLAPLRLVFDQAALDDVHLINEQGAGKEGLPYFEFALPKGSLAAGGTTAPVKVVFFIGKDKESPVRAGKVAETQLRRTLAAAASVTAGTPLAPLAPRAEPYALKAGDGEVKVRFSVALAGKPGSTTAVYLRRHGDRKGVAMNDNGRDGDLVARDGIYGVNIAVDTSGLKPESCLSYEAYTGSGRAEVVSPSLKLCASSFPVRVAGSDTAKPVMLPDGTKAVADEVLVSVVPNTRSDAIRRLAADIGAEVTGSIPPLALYQLKLSAPVSAARLTELVAQLGKRPGVKAASVNSLGGYAYTPNDPEFVNQHGLQRVRAHDVWDTGATGSGVTITILDSGLDKTHPDFGSSPASCQLADNDCGSANTDTVGHGTWVAGVVGARTNNALGVAGVAYGSKIHSVIVAGGLAPTVAQMTQGFTDAAAYGIAPVINASFAVLASTFTNVSPLCAAVNSAVLSGATPVAVVVNAAGNSNSNSYYYPGRCNVNEPAATPHAGQNEALTRKDLLITVANSASVVAPACGSVGLDQRCADSNYGAWVDIAAPGSVIRTTAVGGGYVDESGTSFAAPIVSGAAAILRSCGVPLSQIESTLRTSALVSVAFPDGTSAPRLDVFEALKQRSAPAWAGPTSYSVNENINTAGGYQVGTLAATNALGCDKYTFTIGGGADAGKFAVGGAGNDRLILTDGVLDYETRPGHAYSVIVHVTDHFGRSFDQALTVNLNNLNDPPLISNQAFSVNENSPDGTVVGTVAATDPDAGDTLTYAITGANAGGFVINPATGVLTVGNSAALDYEGVPSHSYTLTVQVTDSGASSASASVTVNLNDVNEPPVIADQAFAIDENSANGTPLGTVLASDPDAGATLGYSIVGPNPGGFVIDPLTGALSVGNSAALDHETHPSYTFIVQASDGVLPGTATITVNVNNVNEPPVIVDQAFSVNENSPTGTAIGLVAATDPDLGDVLTYSIIGPNPGGFVIDPLTGVLSVGAIVPDYEAVPSHSHTLTVQVRDAGMLPASAVVTVSINNVNEPPAGTDAMLPTSEGMSHIFSAADFGFTDPADVPPNGLNAVIVTTLPTAGVLELGGSAVTAGQSIAAADIGNLVFTPAPVAGCGSDDASFTFQVVDDGGTANGGNDTDPSPDTLTFHVTHVNHLASGLPVINGTRTVGQALTVDTSAIGDADGLGAFAYQWTRNGVDIAGATAGTYTLVAADVGNHMGLRVSFTDGCGHVETVLSGDDAVAVGDPHITTVDGLHYDFQSAGEFVALRGANGMEIQLRQAPVSTAASLTDGYSGLTSGVSINTAVAARVGTHRVAYQPNTGGNPSASGLELRVDGLVTTLPPEGLDLGQHARVSPAAGGGIQIDFPDQTMLVATPGWWATNNVWYLNVTVFHTPAHDGIMGARVQGSWLPRLSDGSALGAMPAVLHDRYVELYSKFADSWRVTDQSSLFDYAPGTSTATFTFKDWPKESGPYVAGSQVPVKQPLKRQAAQQLCRGVVGKNENADCVFDVMVMGNPGIAKTHLLSQKIRAGTTAIAVRVEADAAKPREAVVLTATVSRQAAVVRAEIGRRGPVGAVQFTLDGVKLGSPVKLDAKGQARLKVPRLKVGKHQVGAWFVPAKGSTFIASRTFDLSRPVIPLIRKNAAVIRPTK